MPRSAETQPRILRIQHYLFGKYEFRYNVVSNELSYRLKSSQAPFGPMQEAELAFELYEQGFTKFRDELTVLLAAKVPRFDPFTQYFSHLPLWDGETDHIHYLTSFLDVDDPNFFRLMFRKFLVRCVRQSLATTPSYFAKQCLTLVGKQNDGKTSFFDYLVPPDLKRYARKGFQFGTKDSLISLTQNFFINLDELASFEKKELNNEFKNVLSESTVKFRGLYEKNERPWPRRASFVASTNRREFLTDETGNVRWLVFLINAILHDGGGPNGYAQLVNIDLVWSQAYALYKAGFEAELTPEEIKIVEHRNRQFRLYSLEMELVETHFKPALKGDPGAYFLSSSDVKEELKATTKYNLNAIMVGRAITAMEFERS